MDQPAPPPGPLLPPVALAALRAPGAGERWAAVQAELHPRLVQLAELVRAAAARRLPRQWPLYEVSFRTTRYVHRGRGGRDPIDDYWVAFDRPPRGAGVVVAVSGAEEAVLVGLQLWGTRKEALARVWEEGRPVWLPLAERVAARGQARFSERRGDDGLWLDRYLASRGASYLWAGFVYPWAGLPADLADRLVEDVLALLPLNEAVMEEAEAREPHGAALVRERQALYTTPAPPIEVIAERIRARGFAIGGLTLGAYHVALQTRPLVILPGISGTGKTRLTRLYADAVHGIGPGADNPYYLAVAVQPDWHNARDLLGYHNAITGAYHPTPFLRFLLQAAADPQAPYFVCLDEMNLARPEYYLAPILSAMETVERTLDLGAPGPEARLTTGEAVANPVRLPLNLRIIGTVNVDESTHPLSDKILDRANVIELTDVDLEAFRTAYRGPVDEGAWAIIVAAHAAVARAGHAFGYRTVEEMLRYVEQARGTLTPEQAIDLQLKQKVLPRLRGEDGPRLRGALDELRALARGRGPAPRLPESAAKLSRMIERLDQEGFTDFYG